MNPNGHLERHLLMVAVGADGQEQIWGSHAPRIPGAEINVLRGEGETKQAFISASGIALLSMTWGTALQGTLA